ncbi:hypothetical protein JTE90_005770 [Oedothorax gibbosus]|uniref:Uncharacterized protein n=1 Tax=Oedothorax gibbosus TaxID=931172 RepID=A0AAV6URW6_9ARAC|nr:hypothetical protein JTE90_005770 [Oedothorax gibbosus]
MPQPGHCGAWMKDRMINIWTKLWHLFAYTPCFFYLSSKPAEKKQFGSERFQVKGVILRWIRWNQNGTILLQGSRKTSLKSHVSETQTFIHPRSTREGVFPPSSPLAVDSGKGDGVGMLFLPEAFRNKFT